MKFTLKEYQEEAVADVLVNLGKATKRWREDGDRYAFSLTAATGAGKTVMAAAVLEALFYGDDHFSFDPNHGAVVIWFSDDPSLNEQSRFRFLESSDRLQLNDLVVIDNSFNRARFEPKKVYFLNTQKLGKKGLLVRGFDDSDGGELFPETRPDMRSFTIWDTIKNTIEDPELTLYLVMDEAHRGMGDSTPAANKEKSTIVSRLINGTNGVPGIPIVLGISATVDRFNKAMTVAVGRTTMPNVLVDPVRIQDSGLIKDTIALDIPKGIASYDTVLVRRAAVKIKESTAEWAKYTEQQAKGESVAPLLVLQVQNKPDFKQIGEALEIIFQEWGDLPETSVAHVFGEHKTNQFGKYTVPYISPENVQDETSIRVLIAKDAISTGWDCPRAEVMISFRPAQNDTYITQMIGRMVRTPLARRIPGNERLNTVECLLPYFDEQTVNRVVSALQSGSDELPPTGRVLITPKVMKPNTAAPEVVWEKFESLIAQTRPQRSAKPAIRLTALAHELSADKLLPGAVKLAHESMQSVLDAFIESNIEAYKKHRESVKTVQGKTVIAALHTKSTHTQDFSVDADEAVINDAYKRTARIISPAIAGSYTKLLADRRCEPDDDFEDALIEACEDIAALGLIENLDLHFDAQASDLSNKWLSVHRDGIRSLSDDRQDVYRQINALSKVPQDINLTRPVSWMESTEIIEKTGTTVKIPTYESHLMCDDSGSYPVELNAWEQFVLATETGRPEFKFWYRNPARATQDSLGIAYPSDGETKIVRPDFLFFVEAESGQIAVDIIDPHAQSLADALPKLKGLANYAETHGAGYRRIESIGENAGQKRVLNLKDPAVRDAIRKAESASALYSGVVAGNYG